MSDEPEYKFDRGNYKLSFSKKQMEKIESDFFNSNKQSEIMSNINNKIAEGFDIVLKQALQEEIGREPVIEDFKNCTLAEYQDRPFEKHFAYKGKGLGVIITVFPGYENQWQGKIYFQRFRAWRWPPK